MIRFIIHVRTQGIHIAVPVDGDKRIIRQFLNRMSDYEERFIPGRGKVRVVKRTFSTYNKQTGLFGIHVNQLDELLEYLTTQRVDPSQVEIHRHPTHVGTKVYVPLLPNTKPREKQLPICDWLKLPGKRKVLPLQMGVGKAQPLHSKVKIPGGWKRMGDINIGDVVTAYDGSKTNVTGVYDRGVMEVFKITFSDGRSTLCSGDHLWRIHNPNWGSEGRVISTLELMERRTRSIWPAFSIDLIRSEEIDDIDLPLDPYALGLLIGDGGFTHNGLTISTPDQFVIDYIKSILPENMTVKYNSGYDYRICRKNREGENTWLKVLEELNMRGMRSWEKVIPEIYLHGSTKQRLSILQGLLDSDGTVQRPSGSISFTTTSKVLSEQVQYLVRSLGGIAKIGNKSPFFTYQDERREGRPAYVVHIRYKRPSKLFRLERQQKKTNDNNQYAATLKLRVTNIEHHSFEEVRCISIDHPSHLYVTDDFITTHNTYLGLYSAHMLETRTMITMGAMHIDTWLKDAAKFYMDTSCVMVIRGAAQLKKAIHDSLAGKFNKAVILVSTNTIRDYLTEYEEMGESSYGCNPIDLYRVLGVGIRITDEVHENLHFNFRHDIETDVPLSIYMSATIESKNAFINRLYQIIYPHTDRYKGLAWDAYTDVTAVGYHLKEPKRAVYKGGNGMYSHNRYEQYILENKSILNGYLEMVSRIVEGTWVKLYQPGMKILVIFSTVDMCQAAANYFSERFPTHSATAYNADDDDDVLHTFDIVCSTLGSSGTGKNIMGLRTVILTTALSSQERNIQVLGRLRKLDDQFPGEVPHFLYLVCKDIDPQVKYHMDKMVLFRGLVKSHRAINIGTYI